MAAGQWITGVTAPLLAAEWGLHPDTVERDSAEASRRNREDLMDREELRALLVTELQTLRSMSIKGKRYRDAIEAIKALANIMGLPQTAVNGGGGESRPDEIIFRRYVPAADETTEDTESDETPDEQAS